MTENAEMPNRNVESLGTYAEMFTEYLDSNPWAKGPALMLFVFHCRKLCAALDDGGMSNAAMSGAYLNAIRQLEARRPGTKAPADLAGDGGTGDQSSIFDHIED